jgi:CheY-like chemotaxis protein
MAPDNPQNIPHTRHLGDLPPSAPMPPRATDRLDARLPWVIELRVIGTATTIQMQLHERIVIGRSDPDNKLFPQIDLTAYDAYSHGVSRRHAIILMKEGRVTIKDLGSTNGSRLNGFDLDPGEEYRLRHEDELTLGQLKTQVFFTVTPMRREQDDDTLGGLGGEIDVPVVGQGQRILIVEDDDDVGAVFSLALQQAGYNVMLVNTATMAIAEITQQPPDVLVLDLMLPDMSGLDLLHYMRKHNIEGVTTLVVSGATGGFQMNKALEAGAHRFLGKPITIEELIDEVTEAVTPIRE